MKQIKSHALAIRPYTEVDINEFSEGVQRCVELLRKHIRIENSELLPLIEERLSEAERLQMAGQFLDLEEAIPGSSGRQTFPAGVKTLYEKYCLQ